jgi:hypothetical protein
MDDDRVSPAATAPLGNSSTESLVSVRDQNQTQRTVKSGEPCEYHLWSGSDPSKEASIHFGMNGYIHTYM